MHLWRFSLGQHDARAADFFDFLSPDERARARCFLFAENRRHYVIGRGWLRVLLGRYLDMAPARLEFRYGARGKPYLLPPASTAPVCFNLAHTESLALVAVTRDQAVGVDVERVRPVADAEAVAARYFSPREQHELRVLPPGARAETFLRLWTGKEACMKAVGCGLDESLREVEILRADGGVERRVSVAVATDRLVHCWLAELRFAEDHIGVVATVCDGMVDEVAGQSG